MRKRDKFVLSCAIIFGTGLILSGIGIAFGGTVTTLGLNNDGFLVSTPKIEAEYNKNMYEQKEVELDAFTSMDLDLRYADVVIKTSDHYGISYYMEKDKFNYEVNDQKLSISQGFPDQYYGLMWLSIGSYATEGKQEYVTIYVPEDAQLTIATIYTESGNVDCEKGRFSSLKIYSDYGNITLNNVKVTKDLILNADSGDIEFKNVVMRDLKLDCAYGAVLGEQVTFKNAQITMDSGDCNLGRLAFDNVKIDSAYGNVELGVMQPLDDFTYDLHTDYGTVMVGEKNMGESYQSLDQEREKKFEINCESGDIEIQVNE